MRLTFTKSAERKPERDVCRLGVLTGIGRTCELVVALLLLGGIDLEVLPLGGTDLEVLLVLLAGRTDAGASCNGRQATI